jgi:hypothetical protein
MKALQLYAGPRALQHLRTQGLKPEHVALVPGAAGGPKGLILNALDQFIFSDWLSKSSHTVHLVGASIGAWRLAVATFDEPRKAFAQLAHDYIHQQYLIEPGKKTASAQHVSERFAQTLAQQFAGREQGILQHPRYRLHIVTSRGRHMLAREHAWRTPLGYMGAFATNALQRKAMGLWLERVVFSDARDPLPMPLKDYRSRVLALSAENFAPALQASCSIPFALQAVHDIPGAPRGAYWDGGITDYHLHWPYAHMQSTHAEKSLVLYPHFQRKVVPGWLDKSLTWRHQSSPMLDNVIVLAPNLEWVKTLPNHKLPDRQDFMQYKHDFEGRVKVWSEAVARSAQMAEEINELLVKQDFSTVLAL